jgi:hypothetical protein
MPKRIDLFVLVSLMGTAGAGAEERLVSDAGRFSIAMPCAATDVSRVTPGGVSYHQFKCRGPAFAASVAYADYPTAVKATKGALDELRDGAIEPLQAAGMAPRVLDEKPTSNGPYPGRAFRVEIASGMVMADRIYVDQARRRVYTVMAVAPGKSFPEKEVKEFLDSFTMTAK